MGSEELKILETLSEVVALALFGYLIIRVLMAGAVKLAGLWSEATTARAKADTGRNEAEKQMTEVVGRITDSSEKIADSVVLITAAVAAIQTTVNANQELITTGTRQGKAQYAEMLIRLDLLQQVLERTAKEVSALMASFTDHAQVTTPEAGREAHDS